ncbi:hypothetical protein EUX98_g4564 [Antrodiella citrinella]|uniref:Uncharacterized protein n=1 Tax=Antrodiella citrinella TaxID=2447956 RepID=A0A4S4MWG0_9APHY|nr:hypothetical protein EUX98_g4564 [Antrodiella citrinella]
MAQPQAPTFTDITVRTVEEANRLFHVVSLGQAHLFTRRLTVDERRSIYTGCIFVWEERNPTHEATGGFLYYTEKLPEIGNPATVRALLPDKLIKQTYSVWVNTAEGRRKWHLVAYYTEDTQHRLRSADEGIRLIMGGDIQQIPVDAYEPARQPKGARNRNDEVEDDTAPASAPDGTSSHDEPLATPPASGSGSGSLEDRLTTAVDLDNLDLPKIQPRDPLFVLRNCVAVCPDIYQAQNRAILGADASKDLAPLIYQRKTPYKPRHPLDNESLRFCDANSTWLAT